MQPGPARPLRPCAELSHFFCAGHPWPAANLLPRTYTPIHPRCPGSSAHPPTPTPATPHLLPPKLLVPERRSASSTDQYAPSFPDSSSPLLRCAFAPAGLLSAHQTLKPSPTPLVYFHSTTATLLCFWQNVAPAFCTRLHCASASLHARTHPTPPPCCCRIKTSPLFTSLNMNDFLSA